MIYTEKDLDKKLIAQLKKTGNAYKVDSNVGFGFPDVYYVGNTSGRDITLSGKNCFWVEDKVIKTPDCKIKFEAGQPSWLVENYLVAKTFILLYIKSTKQYLLYRGSDARNLRDKINCEPLVITNNFNEIIGELNG